MYVYIHTYFLNKVLCLSVFEVSSQPLRGRPLEKIFETIPEEQWNSFFSFLSLPVIFLSSDYTKEPYSNSELLEFSLFIYKTLFEAIQFFLVRERKDTKA